VPVRLETYALAVGLGDSVRVADEGFDFREAALIAACSVGMKSLVPTPVRAA